MGIRSSKRSTTNGASGALPTEQMAIDEKSTVSKSG